MKVYKYGEPRKKSRTSILLDKSGAFYKVTNGGEDLAHALVSVDQAQEINVGNYSSIKNIIENELKLTLDDVNVFAPMAGFFDNLASTCSRITIESKLVSGKNELPYGVFVFRQDPNDGRIILKPHFRKKDIGMNLIENKNLKNIVNDFFENQIEGRKNKSGILLYGPQVMEKQPIF